MKTQDIELLARLKQLHFDIVTRFHEMESELKTGKCPMKDMVDYAFVLREFERYAKHVRSESNNVMELAARLVTLIWATDPMSTTIETDWCKCTPNPRQHHSSPSFSKNYDQYKTLLSSVGIPEEIIKSGIIETHWERFGDFLTERLKNGVPLPDGIDPERMYTVYRLTMRAKRNPEQQGLPSGTPDLLKESEDGENGNDDNPF